MEPFYITFLVVGAFLMSLVLVPFASNLAKAWGLVDEPSIRKRHVGHVPLAGGMVILIGLWCSLPFLPKTAVVWAVAFLSLPLFLLGALDDRFDLSARLRLGVQLGVGLVLVYGFGLSVVELDGISSSVPLILSPGLAALFTLMCTCGVLNAINMSDGIDGLLGSVASISLAAVALLSLQANAAPEAAISLVVLGLLVGYLAFNLGWFGPGRRVFLGDSGSMVVGLVLLVLLIELSQREDAVITPTSAGWLLGLPLLDTVSVMIRRVVHGRSPFAAGRDHFHHILQDLGLSRPRTLHCLAILQLVMVAVGIFANNTGLPQHYFFWVYVVMTLGQYFGIGWAVRYIAKGNITEHGVDTPMLLEPELLQSKKP